MEGHVGAPFDFERTFVLIPGATLAHGIERQLLQRAREAKLPLAAPSIVTAKMFAARFVQPHREQLSDLATLVAWRETVSDFLAKNSDARGATRQARVSRDAVGQPARAHRRVVEREFMQRARELRASSRC